MEPDNNMDHDLLIKLEAKMDQVILDIKDLKDTTKAQVSDHETRLRNLETSEVPTIKGKLATYAGGLAVLQVVMGVVLWYFSK